jgi:hypothetical protein
MGCLRAMNDYSLPRMLMLLLLLLLLVVMPPPPTPSLPSKWPC